jgi:hypothetical protein
MTIHLFHRLTITIGEINILDTQAMGIGSGILWGCNRTNTISCKYHMIKNDRLIDIGHSLFEDLSFLRI